MPYNCLPLIFAQWMNLIILDYDSTKRIDGKWSMICLSSSILDINFIQINIHIFHLQVTIGINETSQKTSIYFCLFFTSALLYTANVF